MSILDMATAASNVKTSLNVLIYGVPGVGKTKFVSLGPKNSEKVLLIDMDKGCTTAQSLGSNIQVIQPKNLEELMKITQAVAEEPDRFDWVVLDHIGGMESIIFKDIVSRRMAKNPKGNKYKIELQEYLECQTIVSKVVEDLKNSDASIILLAHEMSGYESESARENGEQGILMPAIQGGTGKVSQRISGHMDFVGRMSIQERPGKSGGVVEVLSFNRSDKFVSKDRYNAFPKPVAGLTLASFEKRLKQKESEHNQTTEPKHAAENKEG